MKSRPAPARCRLRDTGCRMQDAPVADASSGSPFPLLPAARPPFPSPRKARRPPGLPRRRQTMGEAPPCLPPARCNLALPASPPPLPKPLSFLRFFAAKKSPPPPPVSFASIRVLSWLKIRLPPFPCLLTSSISASLRLCLPWLKRPVCPAPFRGMQSRAPRVLRASVRVLSSRPGGLALWFLCLSVVEAAVASPRPTD